LRNLGKDDMIVQQFTIHHEWESIDCACAVFIPSDMPLLGDDRSGSTAAVSSGASRGPP
jgi:hypothetical protein